jgi:hypothetical protein
VRSPIPGYGVSDQTVGNVLKPHGIAPAPKRSQSTTWKRFIESHTAVLAGIDFFTVEVLSWRGLVTYYVLFFIHLESRRLSLAGITRHPDQAMDAADGAQRDWRRVRIRWNSRDMLCMTATRNSLRFSGIR